MENIFSWCSLSRIKRVAFSYTFTFVKHQILVTHSDVKVMKRKTRLVIGYGSLITSLFIYRRRVWMGMGVYEGLGAQKDTFNLTIYSNQSLEHWA